jgi:hypothetical protein
MSNSYATRLSILQHKDNILKQIKQYMKRQCAIPFKETNEGSAQMQHVEMSISKAKSILSDETRDGRENVKKHVEKYDSVVVCLVGSTRNVLT